MSSHHPIRRTDAPCQFRVLQMSMMGNKGHGCRAENQDRVLHRSVRGGDAEMHLIAVADGVSRCPHGGEVASYLIERHLAIDPLFSGTNGRRVLQLRKYFRSVNERFYEEFADDPAMLESACTLTAAMLDRDTAHCEWVGDSPIFFSRSEGGRFTTTQLSIPDSSGRLLIDCFGAHAPFQLKHCKVALGIGDILTVASDGVAHGPESFGAMLNRFGATEQLLQAVEAHAKEGEFYDDASFVLAQRVA